jgi:hypothetical protein
VRGKAVVVSGELVTAVDVAIVSCVTEELVLAEERGGVLEVIVLVPIARVVLEVLVGRIGEIVA